MCVVGRVHVKRTRGAYVCMYIQHGRCVYTHMYLYTTPGKMLNTHRPPPLRSTHTYQPQGRVYYQEGVCMCGRSARGTNQMCVVETVHVRRMKGEGREKDEGERRKKDEGGEEGEGGGEDKSFWYKE